MIKTHASKSRKKTTLKKIRQRDLWETEISRGCGSFTTIEIISTCGLCGYGQGIGEQRHEIETLIYPIRQRSGMHYFFLGNSS